MKPEISKIFAALVLCGMAAGAQAAGDVVIAVASTLTTTDPYDANDTLSQAIAKTFYQGLFGFDKDMKLIPVLAESQSVSADGLTYTIKIKSGIKFHDGTPFNAEAVKVNFDRVTNPENKLKRYNLYKNIAKTEAVDATTVRFTLKERFSPFINSLAHPSGVIISPTALAKYGNKGIAQNPVGTGPFKFVDWKTTDYLKAAKWEGYWRKGYPKVDSITWRPVVDSNTRVAVMQTNEAHFAYPMPPEMVETLAKKASLEITSSPSIVQRYLAMNVLQKPFDNPKVRQALNYAINKDALNKVAFAGYAVPAEGVVPPGVEYSVKLGPWPYDPAKARALLKEAGVTTPLELSLVLPPPPYARQGGEVIVSQLAKVGINAKVQNVEWAQWLANTYGGAHNYDLTIISHVEPFDLDNFTKPDYYWGYQNPKFNALYAKIKTTPNLAERNQLLGDAQKLLADDAVLAWLYQPQWVTVAKKGVQGLWKDMPVFVNDLSALSWA